MAQAIKTPDILTDEEIGGYQTAPDVLNDDEISQFESANESSGGPGNWAITRAAKDWYKGAKQSAADVHEAKTLPEKALRMAGGSAGSAMDIFMKLARAGIEGAPKIVQDAAAGVGRSIAETPGIKQGAEAYGKWHAGLSSDAQKDVDAGLNVAGVLPIAKSAQLAGKAGEVAGKAVQGARQAVGGAVENAGKSLMQAGMKPKDVTAKLAGPTVEKGAENLVSDIGKYNLESPVGGYKGIAEKSQKRIDAEKGAAGNEVERFAAENSWVKHDIDESIINFMDDIQNGNMDDVFGSEPEALAHADKIFQALERRGLTGEQPIGNLPKIKDVITNYAGGLFGKGKYGVASDPLPKKVGELMYLQFKKDLEKYVPEVEGHNRTIHDLINVNKAANEAVKRIGNKDKIGLSDLLLFMAPQAAGIHTAAGAVPAALYTGKKLVSGGRGASTLMKAGKAIKGQPESRTDALRRLFEENQ
jgi:hypothetical protein